MASVPEIAQQIVEAGVPVLLVDTCALLDIIRDTARGKNGVKAGLDIARIAAQTPAQLSIVRASVIEDEYQRHLPGAIKALETAIASVNQKLDALDLLAQEVGLNAVVQRHNNTMATSTTQIVQQMFDASLVIDQEPNTVSLAGQRHIRREAPAQIRGKDCLSDCLLFEEYLDLMRTARALKPDIKAVFITSNTADFCDVSKKVHPVIEAQASEVGISVCTNWNLAGHLLRRDP